MSDDQSRATEVLSERCTFDAARPPTQANRQPLQAHDPWVIDFATRASTVPTNLAQPLPITRSSAAGAVTTCDISLRLLNSPQSPNVQCQLAIVFCSGPSLGDPAVQRPITCKGWPSLLLWQCSYGAAHRRYCFGLPLPLSSVNRTAPIHELEMPS